MSGLSTVGRAHLLSRLVAVVALVVVSPILIVAAVAIKLSSKGPVLFQAPRVGLSGRPFVMLKFRTMDRAPSSTPQRITGGRDSRIFPAGRWLRRLKVDELPQLTNIVRGDMVLVGPRPEDPSIVMDHYTPNMMRTLAVVPGLTSPGSLDYFAGEAAMPNDPVEAERVYLSVLLPRKIALDLVYVENRSWHYDLGLVIRTAAAMIGVRALFPRRQAWERLEARALMLADVGATSARSGAREAS